MAKPRATNLVTSSQGQEAHTFHFEMGLNSGVVGYSRDDGTDQKKVALMNSTQCASSMLPVYFVCLRLQYSTQPCEVTIIIPVFQGLGELLSSLQRHLAKAQGTRILTRV